MNNICYLVECKHKCLHIANDNWELLCNCKCEPCLNNGVIVADFHGQLCICEHSSECCCGSNNKRKRKSECEYEGKCKR